jgi:hypothetical protein
MFINSPASPSSVYKRLQRFMKQISFNSKELSLFLMDIMCIPNDQKLTLILDRTNWKFGKVHINILYLAVAYKGMSIPLFYSLLEDKKQGNSDHFDRIDLIELFISVHGKERIECIMGDREFIGKEWVTWLNDEKIPYVLRIKESGQHLSNAKGKYVKAQKLLAFLKPNEKISLGVRTVGKTNGYKAYVSAIKNTKGELVVLIHTANLYDPCELYRQRWEIEVMFKALKTGGFNLEDTHITDYDRIETLVSVLSIACCFAYKIGEIVVKNSKVKLKNNGYKNHSVIRLGLDCILVFIRKRCKKATDAVKSFFKNLIKTLCLNDFNTLDEIVL